MNEKYQLILMYYRCQTLIGIKDIELSTLIALEDEVLLYALHVAVIVMIAVNWYNDNWSFNSQIYIDFNKFMP